MMVLGGGKRLVYLPSAAAAAIMVEWHGGATISWEVDDRSGKPHTVHLMPAKDGESGYQLLRDRYRHWLNMPTSAVGAAVPEPAREAEELDVLPSIVSVRVPFEFRAADGQ
jgi:hypothetical protein